MPKLIRMPQEWELVVDEAVSKSGLTFNLFVLDAIRRRLPKDVAAALPEPKQAGRPPKKPTPANQPME